MDPRRLKSLRWRLTGRVPLLAGWLRQHALRQLVRSGSAEAARVVAEALAGCRDAALRRVLREGLRQVEDPAARDAVAAVWAATRHAELSGLIVSWGWVAGGPAAVRVLTALRLGDQRVLAWGEAEVLALLDACADGDEALARAAREWVRGLQDPAALDVVAARWAETRAGLLLEPLARTGHIPAHPLASRVLLALKLGRGDVLTRDGAAVVGPLLEACADRDPEVAGGARSVLGRLENPAACEAVCRRAIEGGDPAAREAALVGGYEPTEPDRRALFYYLTGQWEAYERLDFDRALLRAAYEAAGEPLRRRVAEAGRQAGRMELVEILADGRRGRRRGSLSPEEWQATLDVLGRNAAWARLWRLAQAAPPRWAARALRRLAEAGWEPGGAGRAEYEELRRLAAGWDETALGAANHCLAVLTGHPSTVECLALSPDGGVLASGGRGDPRVHLWQLPEGRELPPLQGHTRGVTCLAFSPDGQMLASGGQDQAVMVWQIPGGRLLKKFDEPLGPVAALAFHPRGQMVVSLSREFLQVGLLTQHELESRKILCRAATCLAVAPEKAQAATGGQDGRVCVWDLLDGELLREFDGPARPAQALAYRADGAALAAASRDGTVHVWELRGGRHENVPAASVAWAWPGFEAAPVGRKRAPLAGAWRLPDGRLLAARAHGLQVRLWTPSDGRPFAALEGHTRAVLCLASSRDGTLLASGGKDRTIRLWRPTAPGALLAEAPVEEMSLDDWDWVRTRLGMPELSPAERRSLLFLDAVMRHRWRSDVHVEEALPRYAGGAHDITVEG